MTNSTDASLPRPRAAQGGEDLATQFWQLWQNGPEPDAREFLTRVSPPTAAQVRQAQKWQNTPTNAVAFFKQVGQSLRLNPLPTRTTGIAGTPLAKIPAYLAPQATASRVYFAQEV